MSASAEIVQMGNTRSFTVLTTLTKKQ